MAPLKSLEHEHPLIDSRFQLFCASHSIFSVEDFLIQDLYTLAASTNQHSDSEHLKQGIAHVISIIDGLHQPWLNGLELLEEAQQNKHTLSVGCERIDMLLQGGLCVGHLTELVGPSSSGKTQICLQAAANVAKIYLGNVIFFDTGNSFSPKRLAHIVHQISDPDDIESNEILQQAMNRIVCRSVYDIFILLDALHQLKSNLNSQTSCSVQMLVVDSISSLITPILGNGAHGHALMVTVGFLLKELAYEHNLSVLVTNHMVRGEGGHPKPALGESWKNMPHVRLHLSRDCESNTCNMSILTHPEIAAGKAVKFTLL